MNTVILNSLMFQLIKMHIPLSMLDVKWRYTAVGFVVAMTPLDVLLQGAKAQGGSASRSLEVIARCHGHTLGKSWYILYVQCT